ncbi:LMOD1 protein, partial [Uria aalge]|nr:LMOD1 protein [Uria aalge]
MSKVAKYRRQVSEDPDIDSLLSTLSPEEMEELEKELDVVDTDGSIPLEPSQKNQTENSPPGPQNCDTMLNHCEKETRKRIQREQSVDVSHISPRLSCKQPDRYLPPKQRIFTPKPPVGLSGQEARNLAPPSHPQEISAAPLPRSPPSPAAPAAPAPALAQHRERCCGRSDSRQETGKDKKEEKDSVLKKGTGKDKKEEEKSSGLKKEAEKDTKGEDKKEKDKKEESSALKKSKADEKEKSQPEAEKAAEEKQKAKAAAEGSPSKPTTGSSPDQAKDDEASSIFDELIDKVKNNDAEVTEVNVNNSDCINNETLVRFTEALEFNTVVKLFALANTRADDHVAFAIAIMLKSNKVLTSINLDSNHITGKGILAIFRALLQNNTLTELRFHNQRHICGGKTEMEIAKLLKENTTLLKLGYHFELAGPRMTVTNLLSRNMDKQRQKRLQEQKLAQERGEKKDLLEVPKPGALPKGSPKPSPQPSPKASPKSSPKKGGAPAAPPPPPPPLAPPLINENLRNSLSPATQRKLGDRALPVQEKNSRDQLLAAIRSSNLKQLKKASAGPRWG